MTRRTNAANASNAQAKRRPLTTNRRTRSSVGEMLYVTPSGAVLTRQDGCWNGSELKRSAAVTREAKVSGYQGSLSVRGPAAVRAEKLTLAWRKTTRVYEDVGRHSYVTQARFAV